MQDLADRYDLWCDFDQEYHGRAQTLITFAKNPSGVRRGERLRVGDHGGRRAYADILDVHTDGVVILNIDPTTFYMVPRV